MFANFADFSPQRSRSSSRRNRKSKNDNQKRESSDGDDGESHTSRRRSMSFLKYGSERKRSEKSMIRAREQQRQIMIKLSEEQVSPTNFSITQKSQATSALGGVDAFADFGSAFPENDQFSSPSKPNIDRFDADFPVQSDHSSNFFEEGALLPSNAKSHTTKNENSNSRRSRNRVKNNRKSSMENEYKSNSGSDYGGGNRRTDSSGNQRHRNTSSNKIGLKEHQELDDLMNNEGKQVESFAVDWPSEPLQSTTSIPTNSSPQASFVAQSPQRFNTKQRLQQQNPFEFEASSPAPSNVSVPNYPEGPTGGIREAVRRKLRPRMRHKQEKKDSRNHIDSGLVTGTPPKSPRKTTIRFQGSKMVPNHVSNYSMSSSLASSTKTGSSHSGSDPHIFDSKSPAGFTFDAFGLDASAINRDVDKAMEDLAGSHPDLSFFVDRDPDDSFAVGRWDSSAETSFNSTPAMEDDFVDGFRVSNSPSRVERSSISSDDHATSDVLTDVGVSSDVAFNFRQVHKEDEKKEDERFTSKTVGSFEARWENCEKQLTKPDKQRKQSRLPVNSSQKQNFTVTAQERLVPRSPVAKSEPGADESVFNPDFAQFDTTSANRDTRSDTEAPSFRNSQLNEEGVGMYDTEREPIAENYGSPRKKMTDREKIKRRIAANKKSPIANNGGTHVQREVAEQELKSLSPRSALHASIKQRMVSSEVNRSMQSTRTTEPGNSEKALSPRSALHDTLKRRAASNQSMQSAEVAETDNLGKTSSPRSALHDSIKRRAASSEENSEKALSPRSALHDTLKRRAASNQSMQSAEVAEPYNPGKTSSPRSALHDSIKQRAASSEVNREKALSPRSALHNSIKLKSASVGTNQPAEPDNSQKALSPRSALQESIKRRSALNQTETSQRSERSELVIETGNKSESSTSQPTAAISHLLELQQLQQRNSKFEALDNRKSSRRDEHAGSPEGSVEGRRSPNASTPKATKMMLNAFLAGRDESARASPEAVVAPDSSLQKLPALKDEPEYQRYFKMLKVGMPMEVVKHAMARDGLDPSVMDGDHNKPVKPVGIPLKDDPEYTKYFKMLKVGMPMDAVKHAMERDGLDSSLMDKDHSLPVEKTKKSNEEQPKKKDTHRRARLHWKTLRKVTSNSLWARIDKEREMDNIEIDEQEFQELFQARRDGPSTPKSATVNKNKSVASVRVIDPKRANNGGIILARLKMSHDDMADVVDRIDEKALTLEQIENIIEYLPTKEERKALESYMLEGGRDAAEKFDGLCECEKFMVSMMTVKHAKRKVRALLFKLQFVTCLEDIEQDTDHIEMACDELINSSRLRQLLGIILTFGNRLNTAGNGKKKAGAFTLDSLLKLNQAKAFDKKTTFLHYIVLIVQRNNELLLTFKDDLPTVFKTDKIYWDQCLADLTEVENQLENVRKIALYQAHQSQMYRLRRKKKSEVDGDESFSDDELSLSLEEEVEALRASPIGVFTLNAIKYVSALREKVEETRMKLDRLFEYFGEEDKTMQPHELFVLILTFIRDFDKAKEVVLANEKKKLREERKRQAGEKGKPPTHTSGGNATNGRRLKASNMQPNMSRVIEDVKSHSAFNSNGHVRNDIVPATGDGNINDPVTGRGLSSSRVTPKKIYTPSDFTGVVSPSGNKPPASHRSNGNADLRKNGQQLSPRSALRHKARLVRNNTVPASGDGNTNDPVTDRGRSSSKVSPKEKYAQSDFTGVVSPSGNKPPMSQPSNENADLGENRRHLSPRSALRHKARLEQKRRQINRQ